MKFAFLLFIAIALSSIAGAGICALPKFAVPDMLGVNIHFTGENDDQIKMIADAGLKLVRMDFFWQKIEREKGKYDFSEYDALLRSLEKHGIRALFILDYGNPLYENGASPTADGTRRAFAAFAKSAAARYKGKDIIWEIWNEPNLPHFWQPNPHPENYVKLAEAVSKAVREADPEAFIVGPALGGWDFTFAEDAFRLGLLKYVDAVSLHAYGAARPEMAAEYYEKIRTLVAKYAPNGKKLPIISSEWGYSSMKGTSAETQAQYLVRSFLTNIMSDAKLSIWYDWQNDGDDPNENEHNFGTVDHNLKRKPAYAAVQVMTDMLDGFEYAGRIDAGNPEDYFALFRNGGEYMIAAWTSASDHKVNLTTDVSGFDLITLTGEAGEVLSKNGTAEIALSGAVQYLSPKEPSKRLELEARFKAAAAPMMNGAVPCVQIKAQCGGKGAVINVSGDGISPAALKTSGSATGDHIINTPLHTIDRPLSVIKIELTADGIAQPLVRTIQIDESNFPTLKLMPPCGDKLMISIDKGSLLSGKPAKFRIAADGEEGIEPTASATEVALEADEQVKIVALDAKPTAQKMRLGLSLADPESGALIAASPVRRYEIVDAFSGEIGSAPKGFKPTIDGDPKIKSALKTRFAAAPAGIPQESALKADYEFASGWSYVNFLSGKKIEGEPVIARVWLLGMTKSGMARLRFMDSTGQTFQPDFGVVNFDEWRCLSADMTGAHCGYWLGANDGKVHYPVKWQSLFILDNVGGGAQKGSFYIGPMMLAWD